MSIVQSLLRPCRRSAGLLFPSLKYSPVLGNSVVSERSMTSVEPPKQENKALSAAQKLKKAVAEYGSTVIVFHVGISLVSLGTSYTLVSNGLDVNDALVYLGLNSENGTTSLLATNASTFAVAYAIHKVFAPVRIMITLGATPFIVRYLRSVGVLKVK